MRSPCAATKSSSHSPQLEKACTQQRRPNTAKKKEKNFAFTYFPPFFKTPCIYVKKQNRTKTTPSLQWPLSSHVLVILEGWLESACLHLSCSPSKSTLWLFFSLCLTLINPYFFSRLGANQTPYYASLPNPGRVNQSVWLLDMSAPR